MSPIDKGNAKWYHITPMLSTIRALPRTIINTALELVYPRSCRVCGGAITSAEKLSLCEACHKKIRYDRPLFLASAGKAGYYFDRVRSATVYEGVMRECIHKFKYNGSLSLEALFADLMTNFAEKYMDMRCFDFIIPVPLSTAKLRERSFNQAYILASAVSRKFKIPCVANNLTRVKAGRPQVDLAKKARLKDIEGAFRLKRPALLKDKSVLLIDDVFTTGATVNECSKVLKRSGVKYIEVLTLAQGR